MHVRRCLLLLLALLLLVQAQSQQASASAPAPQPVSSTSSSAGAPQGTAAVESGNSSSNGSSRTNGSVLQLASDSNEAIGLTAENPIWVATGETYPPPPVTRPTELIRAPTPQPPAPNNTMLTYANTFSALKNGTFSCLNDGYVNLSLYTLCLNAISYPGTTYCPYECFKYTSSISPSCLRQIRGSTNATYNSDLTQLSNFCGIETSAAAKVSLELSLTFLAAMALLLLLLF